MRYVESINASLHSLMAENSDVIVLGEDILDPYGGAFKVTKGLSSAFPERVLTTPISEAGITGFATGLAIKGYRPILEIMFGDFITLCADQIINGASKFRWMYNQKVTVPLCIRTPMGGYRGYGPTHSQSLESLFLGVPGINIIAPSHYHNPGEILSKAVLTMEDPTLFIENKLLYPEKINSEQTQVKVNDFFIKKITNTDNKFPTVSLIIEKDEIPDITLITYGGMSLFASKAVMNMFFEEEILVEILIPSLIKPIPIEDFLPSINRSGRCIVLEEGIKTSGWGAELSSQINEKSLDFLKTPVIRMGAKDLPIPSAKTLENSVLPQIKDIEQNIRNLI